MLGCGLSDEGCGLWLWVVIKAGKGHGGGYTWMNERAFHLPDIRQSGRSTKCMLTLLYGLDACPVSPRQLRSLNHVVVSCGKKMFNVNTSEIAAECLKMFGVCDVAEAVATRKDRFVKRRVE